MAKWQIIIYVLLVIGINRKPSTHQPVFCTLSDELEKANNESHVLDLFTPDSSHQHKVYLLKDSLNNPLLYYSSINTPVCIDNLCKPLIVVTYWNLVGKYAGYGLVDSEPLSKFDHEQFDQADYRKLHELLLDDQSILSRRRLEQLYDQTSERKEKITYRGVEVDAITAATKKEIKESVVEGALYSCYALWHLVNGNIKKQMRSQIPQLIAAEEVDDWLYSRYSDYQEYALKTLPSDEYSDHAPRIISLIKSNKPTIRNYVVKKLPEQFWTDEKVTVQLYSIFSELDINSKTLLLQKLDQVPNTVFHHVSGSVKDMSRNQLKIFISKLSRSSLNQDALILDQLRRTAADTNFPFGYLIDEYLNP